MLESASGSLPSYPGHPPAANGGLVSLVPDLNSWPSEGAQIRRAAAIWSKRLVAERRASRPARWLEQAIRLVFEV